ncbi:M48 family metallopeptidase [Tropicimonas sp. IMCC6043]|uniref:M48 family metallopeptidase n=1 Tax=Tropicimonas sp. IMCC6043 TaxID=2510645 RepID=UPI00101DBE37|nr:SprT family zinc-dependent metalloprotease [Tropicimonas sp. IMCC6043]RYH08805.1 M48 family peptidase [Tropicimonas sp. IMCC6043]
MSEHMLPGDPPVQLVLRRSARARRYSLRVSRLDGRVTLTMPRTASPARALNFAQEKAAWIRARLAERPDEIRAEFGAVLPVGGVEMRVVEAARSRLNFSQARIEVSDRVNAAPPVVAGLLKAHARDRLVAAADRYSGALGRPYSRITIRDTRSRWGSCSAQGALMFSWRLVLAPPQVLDYVAAHEVAHLAEMNHGPRFWAAVARLRPGYAPERDWLRAHGEALHRYRFTAAAIDGDGAT